MNSTKGLSEANITEQLVTLRKITELSGTLHEAQIGHLRLYWKIYADSTDKELAIDFDNQILEFRQAQDGVLLEDYAAPFVSGVKFIVGDDWVIRIKKGDEYINLG